MLKILIQLLAFLSLSVFTSSLLSDASNHQPDLKQIDLGVTTHLGDNQIFYEDDSLSFYISLDRDAYIYGFYKDATGTLFQVLPSPAHTDHQFTAGDYFQFPVESSPFQFTVKPPFGEETLYLFATDTHVNQFAISSVDSQLRIIKDSIETVSTTIKQASIHLYGEASIDIITQHR